MTRRAEHFFGDIFRSHPEDEYIDMAIIPAGKRKQMPTGVRITMRQVRREIKHIKELLRMELMA